MTNEAKAVFLDTNVLIRATVESAPFHKEVYEAVNRLRKTDYNLWVSRQVLREYAAVLTRPQTYTTPLSPSTLTAQMRTLTQCFQVADETAQVSERLWALLETVPTGGKQVHDANIVATMQAHGLTTLFTLNTADFVRFVPVITLLTLEEILKS